MDTDTTTGSSKPEEARQADPGLRCSPSSPSRTGLAILVLGAVWFVFSTLNIFAAMSPGRYRRNGGEATS